MLHEKEVGLPFSDLRNGHLKRNIQHAPHLLHSPVLLESTGSRRLVKNLFILPSNGPLFSSVTTILPVPIHLVVLLVRPTFSHILDSPLHFVARAPWKFHIFPLQPRIDHTWLWAYPDFRSRYATSSFVAFGKVWNFLSFAGTWDRTRLLDVNMYAGSPVIWS